ncbi:MAG: GntR family transcriptional regulator [Planctomycetota bacterium]|jgi:DNA-binding transcriptional MocR family regulator
MAAKTGKRKPGSQKYKYEAVADRLSEMIRKGAISPGQRVPSIRAMARQMAVGVATVIEAYHLLEDRRLIESRPQSGFYARDPELAQRPANSAPPEPETRRLPLKPTSVRVWSCLHSRMEVVGPRVVLPGAAIPSPQFLPIERLNRICARILRTEPDRATQYEFPPGYAGLRVAIARRAFDAGCNLGPEDIVITNGATEALMLALRAVTSSGDTVAVESPCYFGILHRPC